MYSTGSLVSNRKKDRNSSRRGAEIRGVHKNKNALPYVDFYVSYVDLPAPKKKKGESMSVVIIPWPGRTNLFSELKATIEKR